MSTLFSGAQSLKNCAEDVHNIVFYKHNDEVSIRKRYLFLEMAKQADLGGSYSIVQVANRSKS